jgi:hypothetical protein
MANPYLRTQMALSYIKGEVVEDWVRDQITTITNKVTRVQNPVGRDEEILWDEFLADFRSRFADTTKKENAQHAITQLTMRREDLDGYINAFKRLANDAGYSLDAAPTVRLFSLGLAPSLLSNILQRDTEPDTMDEWIAAAKTEQKKAARRDAYLHPNKRHFAWVDQPKNGGRRQPYIHPNDRTVPMDVDVPVFTSVNRAITEEDKNVWRKEGRCFRCDKQGHMASECPTRKQQPFKPSFQKGYHHSQTPQRQDYRGPRKFQKKKAYNAPRHPKGNPRAFHKPAYVRAAAFEENEEDGGEENEPEDQVDSLAARAAFLPEDKREQWLGEMAEYNIHF